MLRLTPTGKFLVNFCYVNLYADDGQAALLSGASFMEKLQFHFVKRRVGRLVDKISIAMFHDKKFDIDLVIDSVAGSKKDLWDLALVIVIVRYLASLPTEKALVGSEGNVSRVLALYLDFIKAERTRPREVLDLKLQMERLKCGYDLQFAAERYRRSML